MGGAWQRRCGQWVGRMGESCSGGGRMRSRTSLVYFVGTLIGDVEGCELSFHLGEQNLRVCGAEGWNLNGDGGDGGCGRLRVCKLVSCCQSQGRAREMVGSAI